MPSKKKKGSAARPPLGGHSDSLRADIAASRGGADAYDDDGEDIAAQLLASLDARDNAEAKVEETSTSNHSIFSHSPIGRRGSLRKDKSNTDSVSSSGSPTEKGGASGLIDKILHPHSSRSPPTSPPSTSPPISATSSKDGGPASPPSRSGQGHGHGHGHGIMSSLFGSHGDKKSADAAEDDDESQAGLPTSHDEGQRKVGRQKARKQRKEAEAAAERARIEEELKANGGKVDEAALERQGITYACESLNVDMHEITPDGHCLYSAIADQLNLLGKGSAPGGGGGGAVGESYKTTRAMTARWMRGHEEDFKPFISDNDERMAGVGSPGGADVTKGDDPYQAYCDAVERTAVWGGQPEILAMSRAYRTPIWVVQAGSPIVKVGEDEFPEEGRPLMISYHRKMYGLGEHYNSLRGKGNGAGVVRN